ncbi:MAG TPA: pyridoxal-dependent decarboxylase, partial [Balneolaceae bacterium]|nr:pyridoxal-dependent decarboxylase [Balneolaceae bacterium]
MNKSEIKKLQKRANRLELSAKERDKLTEQAIRYGENFLENLPAQKAFVQTDKKASLPSFSDEPTSFDQLLSVLHEEVDSNGLNPPSGNHLGYIPAGGLYPSALGDFLAAVTNRYAGSLYNAPGAVRMENQCLRWLCDLIGYPEGAGGNLTSGGSIANLIGMANA